MKTQANTADWQWLSATGRQFRARPADEVEWSEFDADALGDKPYLTAIVRRSDGAGVVVPHYGIDEIRHDTDEQLGRFDRVLNMMTIPIDLNAMKTELEK